MLCTAAYTAVTQHTFPTHLSCMNMVMYTSYPPVPFDTCTNMVMHTCLTHLSQLTDMHIPTCPIWHTCTNMVIYTSYPPVPYIRHAQTWWCTFWHTCTNMVMYPCPTHLSHSTHMHKHGDVGMGSGQRMQEWRGLRRQGDVGLWRSSSQLLQQDGAARIFQRSVQRLQFLQHVIQVEQALFHHLGLSWQRLKQTGNKK